MMHDYLKCNIFILSHVSDNEVDENSKLYLIFIKNLSLLKLCMKDSLSNIG